MRNSIPVILCLSGHDPTGGAGVQADIETIKAHGCHAISIVTCLTEQDTENAYRILPQTRESILTQAQTLLDDVSIDAIKIGLIGTPEIAEAISQIIQSLPDKPVILDPVLAAGGGFDMEGSNLIETIKRQILPSTSIITPNTIEAQKLTQQTSPKKIAESFFSMGVQHCLITGTHDVTDAVINRLFKENTLMSEQKWPRLHGEFHGSGCTLASAIAANLAKGLTIKESVIQAQSYTWHSLKNAYTIGKGQSIPERKNECP